MKNLFLLTRLLVFTCAIIALHIPALAQISTAPADVHLERVREADARCAQVPVAPVTAPDVLQLARGRVVEKIIERPVVLCAHGETTGTWHVIQVNLEYPVPREYYACIKSAPTLPDRTRCVLPYRLVTPGYTLEHVRGSGVTRLIWNVHRELPEVERILNGGVQSEKLVVYRSRHLWFDDSALSSGDIARIISTATAVNYTPYHPEFHDAELVTRGARQLHEHVVQALDALDRGKANGIMSRALPDRTLGNAIPWEILMALALIEQIDDMTFHADKIRTVESILIEYALNGDMAFHYSQSGANAIGPMQFTDESGNGTYTAVVLRGYPEIGLDPVFQSGARNLANVLKVAVALIDHELATFPESIPLYKKNPKRGGTIPVARYNGGPLWGIQLLAWLKRNKVDITKVDAPLPSVLYDRRVERCQKNCMRRGRDGKVRRVEHIVVTKHNTETPGYLVKYRYVINYLADLELDQKDEISPAR